MVNRKLMPAPAGMVLGMTGFGKSFAVMQMMAGIMLRWPEDDLLVIDPGKRVYTAGGSLWR